VAEAKLTERDLELLELAGRHRLLLAAHAQALLGTSLEAARRRLRALTQAGFLERRRVFHGQPACYQITRQGLAAIGSSLPRPNLDLSCYRHDVGVAWLWLLAQRGKFGPLEQVIAERQLRSRDAGPELPAEPAGVRLGGYGPGGRERLHYPDLLLVTPQGHRIALELELSAKGRTRREQILLGYAVDPRIDLVVYLVDRPATARAIETSARRLGIADRVRVQRCRWEEPAGARTAVRAPTRIAVRAATRTTGRGAPELAR